MRATDGSTAFHVELGDLPTWLLAAFAFLALLAAGGAYFEQRRAGSELAEQVKTQAKALADQQKATTALADLTDQQRRAMEDQQTANALQARIIERELRAVSRQQAEQIRYEQDTPYGKDDGSGGVHRVKATNESARPIREVACRLAHDQRGQHCTVEWAGRIIRIPGPGRAPTITTVRDRVEGEQVKLIRRGETWGFVFPVDAVDGEEIPALLRFTDDAGLYWQVDNDLHLEQLAERDW